MAAKKKSALKNWQVLQSKITYGDRWLRLRTDQCETPRGHILETYHVIEMPTWVNVIAVTEQHQVVLVREYRHGAGRVVLGLPSGTQEASERSAAVTTRRELREETGYRGGVYFGLGSYYANPATQTNRVHSFLALGVQPGAAQKFDLSEDIEVVLMDFTDFMAAALGGKLELQGLHLSALALALGLISTGQNPRLKALAQKLPLAQRVKRKS